MPACVTIWSSTWPAAVLVATTFLVIAIFAVGHYRLAGGWRIGAFAVVGFAYALALALIAAPFIKAPRVHVASAWSLDRSKAGARLCASNGTCIPLATRRLDGAGSAYGLRTVAREMSVAAPNRVFAVHFVDEGVVKVERCASGE